jgi:NADP-dependent 3-hydroxy acid dehydrogenase YdfG
MSQRLNRRRALVNGGSSGSGEAIAVALAASGSRLASYITARTIFVDGSMTDNPEFAPGG